MRGSKLFLEAVRRHGVTKCFGIVGGEAGQILFNEVPEIDFYLTRHEFAAGMMCDVYTRQTGQMQMCYSTFGPGLTNLMTGVSSALLDRTPMLAVSAQVDRPEKIFNITHQCLNNAEIMRPMVKYSYELDNLEEIPEVVAAASTAAKAELPGPSYISFPRDLMGEEIDDAEAMKLLDAMASSEPEPAPPPPKDEMEWFREQLVNAKRPVCLAGNVVIREQATAELRQFLEAYQIPLFTSLASKGLIPEDHPLHIGAVNKYLDGILHDKILDGLFGDADLVVLVGFDFGEDVKPAMWERNPNGRTISFGPHVNTIEAMWSPERHTQGGVKHGLKMLIETAPKSVERDPKALEFIHGLREKKRKSGMSPIQDYPVVPPQMIVKTVREAIGKDGILCSDIGLHKQYAGLFSETWEPNTFMCSNGCGSFGFGLPAGMGAKLANPHKRVAVICGDGGFHSTSQDLETCVRYNLPIVIVMMKDNSFGLIKYYQLTGRDEIHANAVDFGDVDFVRLAEANGVVGHAVMSRKALEARINEAFESNKPTLIEVPVRYQYRF